MIISTVHVMKRITLLLILLRLIIQLDHVCQLRNINPLTEDYKMYKILLLVIKKQQIIKSSKHNRSLCHLLKKSLHHVIILYCISSPSSTDIFIVYILSYYIIIVSCLYAVPQGNVPFSENGNEENII